MNEDPIGCRTAMLELNVDFNGMAKLLNLDHSRIVKMCATGENIPQNLVHKVRILLNTHRNDAVKRPIMEEVLDLMWYLHKQGGAAQFDKLRQKFVLSGRQMKNVEQVEGWITLVWELDKTGRHAFAYLTAAGYRKLGVVMPDEAMRPSDFATPLVCKGLDDVQQILVDHFNEEIAYHLKRADTCKQLRTLVATGLMAVDKVVEMYDALTNDGGVQPLKLTNDQET